MDSALQRAQALIITANAKYADLGEPITPELQAQLETMDSLHSQLLQGSMVRGSTLSEALASRGEYGALVGEVKEWLDQAEGRLVEAERGVDYPRGEDQLHQHRVGSNKVD